MTKQIHRDADTDAEITALRQRVMALEAEVAAHEQTRLSLIEQYSFRKAVIERAAEGLCVCHAISDYPFVQFTEWNTRMNEITGYSMEEINRLGWYQTMYPDSLIQEKASQRMLEMREGEDLRGELWEIVRADGEKRVFSISTSILKSSDGLIHALGLMQDITDEVKYRRLLESQLLQLEGLLPICASCKKIRDNSDIWHHLEVYIKDHSGAEFTHSICPDCRTKLYPDLKCSQMPNKPDTHDGV